MNTIKRIIVLLIILIHQDVSAQFFRGIGIYGAGTQSRHKYKNRDANKREFTATDYVTNPNYYSARNYISKERFSWGLGVFAEFLDRDHMRWQTEFEYANKGSKEREFGDPFLGTMSSGFGTNRYTYISWNNYLKFIYDMGLVSHWYYMIGVRLEYLFKKSTPANSTYSSAFRTIWFTGDVAIGTEYPLFWKLNWFIEGHYNPDITNTRVNSTLVRNRTFEARIGIIYRPRRRSIDDCNAPKYRGPAY